MTQLGSAYGEIRIGTGDAERNVQSLADKMRNIGTRMSLGISLPLAAVGKMGLQAAGNFEQSMNTIQSVSGATADQMSAMSAKALQLGKDTSFSAGEAADGMLELAKAGLTAEESMASIGGVLDLAAAGSLSVAQAAEITANALNAFQLPAKDAARVADLLAAAANASSIEVGDMAYSFSQAAADFAANGQSIEDLATGIAILGNNGIKGEKAGTALRGALTRLAAPTGKAKGLIEALGIQVYNADGSMRSFEAILGNVGTATEGMSDAQRNAALNTIFGVEAQGAMNILLSAGTAEWNEMKVAVSQAGAAQEVAEARMKGLNGAFAYIKGTVESTLIKAFLPFTEQLGEAIRYVADLIARLGDLPQPVINAALAFGAVLAAAGPLLVALPAIGAALAALLSPITLIVAGVATLAAAWAGNWGDIQGKTMAVVGVIRGLLTDLWTGITTGDWEPLRTSLAEIGAAIATNVAAWATALTDWAKDVWATLSTNLAALKLNLLSWIRVISDVIRFDMPIWVASFTDWAKDVWSTLSTNLAAMWTSLSGWIGETAPLIVEEVGKWAAAFSGWAGLVWTALSLKLATLWTSLSGWIVETAPLIVEEVGKWASAFTDWATGVWSTLKTNLDTMRDSLSDWIGLQKLTLQTRLLGWKTQFSIWATDIWGDLKPKVDQLWTDLKGWITETSVTIAEHVGVWKKQFSIWADNTWIALKPKIDQLWTDLKGWIAETSVSIVENVGKWASAFSGWTANVWTTLQPKLIEIGNNILAWVREQGPKIERETKTWRDAIVNWAPKGSEMQQAVKPLGTGLLQGILALQETVSIGFGYMVGAAIGGAIRFISDGVALFVTGIIGSINNMFASPKSSESVGSGFWKMITGMISNVPKAFGAIGVGFWDQIKAYLGGVPATLLEEEWAKLGENAKQVWTRALNDLQTITNTAWAKISATVASAMTGLTTTLFTAWVNINASAVGSWALLSSSATTAWNGIKTSISNLVQTLDNTLRPKWRAIQSAATMAFGVIASAMAALVAAKDAIVTAFTSLKTFIGGLSFGNPFGGLLGAIQSIIDKVNAARSALAGLLGAQAAAGSYNSPGVTSGGSIGGNAMGDHWWRGGLTWVGERGPELIDVPRGARIYDNTSSKQLAGGERIVFENHYHIYNEVDAEVAAHRTAQILRRYNS